MPDVLEGQDLILNQLSKFIDIESEDDKAAFEAARKTLTDPKAIEQLEKFEKERIALFEELKEILKVGHCFGFDICHAAMDDGGKLNWWEHYLVTIANWSGTKSSLHQEIILPDADATFGVPTLRTLMWRSLDYFVITQVADLKRFKLDGMSQLRMLLPDAHVIPPTKTQPAIQKSYFEYLDGKNIKTAKTHGLAVGWFSHAELKQLLDENYIQKLCLVQNWDHGVRIGCYGQTWIIYDPNYKHTDIHTIHKMGTKDEIITEIFAIQGQAVAIEVASTEGKPIAFPGYDDLLKNSPLALLKGQGLFLMAKYKPQKLTDIFSQIDDTNKSKYRDLILESFLIKTYSSWNVIHVLAVLAPSVLGAVFELVDTSPEGEKLLVAIIDALNQKNNKKSTAFHYLAEYAPFSLFRCFQLADQSPNGRRLVKKIGEALGEKNANGYTGLEVIVRCCPWQLNSLFALVDATPEGQELQTKIVKAFRETNANQDSLLHVLAQMDRTKILPTIKFVLQFNSTYAEYAKSGFAAVLEALAALNSQKISGFAAIKTASSLTSDYVVDAMHEHLNTLSINGLTYFIKTIFPYYSQSNQSDQLFWKNLLDKILDVIANQDWFFQTDSLSLQEKVLENLLDGLDRTFFNLNLSANRELLLQVVLKLKKYSLTVKNGQDFFNGILQKLVDKFERQFFYSDFSQLMECGQEIKSFENKFQIDLSEFLQKLEEMFFCDYAYRARFHSLVGTDPDKLIDEFSQILKLDENKNSWGLNLILRLLAFQYQAKTGWQIITTEAAQYKPKVLQLLTTHLEKLDAKNLVAIGAKIRLALYEDNDYHGLCNERHFGRGEYGKTSIWQALLGKVQTLLQKTNTNDSEVGLIMQERVGRWF